MGSGTLWFRHAQRRAAPRSPVVSGYIQSRNGTGLVDETGLFFERHAVHRFAALLWLQTDLEIGRLLGRGGPHYSDRSQAEALCAFLMVFSSGGK